MDTGRIRVSLILIWFLYLSFRKIFVQFILINIEIISRGSFDNTNFRGSFGGIVL